MPPDPIAESPAEAGLPQIQVLAGLDQPFLTSAQIYRIEP